MYSVGLFTFVVSPVSAVLKEVLLLLCRVALKRETLLAFFSSCCFLLFSFISSSYFSCNTSASFAPISSANKSLSKSAVLLGSSNFSSVSAPYDSGSNKLAGLNTCLCFLFSILKLSTSCICKSFENPTFFFAFCLPPFFNIDLVTAV